MIRNTQYFFNLDYTALTRCLLASSVSNQLKIYCVKHALLFALVFASVLERRILLLNICTAAVCKTEYLLCRRGTRAKMTASNRTWHRHFYPFFFACVSRGEPNFNRPSLTCVSLVTSEKQPVSLIMRETHQSSYKFVTIKEKPNNQIW